MSYKARGKTFLNDNHEEFGAVAWNVRVGHGREGCKWVNADLRVSDCDDSISLDFYCNSERRLSKRMDKLDVLINELLDFKAALMEAGELIKPAKVY